MKQFGINEHHYAIIFCLFLRPRRPVVLTLFTCVSILCVCLLETLCSDPKPRNYGVWVWWTYLAFLSQRGMDLIAARSSDFILDRKPFRSPPSMMDQLNWILLDLVVMGAGGRSSIMLAGRLFGSTEGPWQCDPSVSGTSSVPCTFLKQRMRVLRRYRVLDSPQAHGG
jgi:hypothetical protein